MMRRIQQRNEDQKKFAVIDIHMNTLNDFRLNTSRNTKASGDNTISYKTPRVQKYHSKARNSLDVSKLDLLKMNSSQEGILVHDEINNLNESITKMTDVNRKTQTSKKASILQDEELKSNAS